MERKKFLLFAGVLAGLAGPALADPVELNFWSIDKEDQYTFVLMREFNAAHPDIHVTVKHVDFADIVNDAMRAVATGNTPDLIGIDNPETALFASRGALLDLTAYVEKSAVVKADDFYPGPRASATWDGKLYALPRASNTIALYYNADMFKAAGLDPDKPPRTWAEMLADARKLNDPAKNVYGIAFSAIASEEGTFQFLPFLQMAGGDYQHVATDGGVRALELWQTLLDEKLASPDTLIRGQWDSTGTFNAGNAAMVISGPWELPRMSAEAKFDWRVALLPLEKEGGERASALGDYNNAIFARTKHPKEAFEVLEFLHQQMPRVWNDFGFLPAAKNVEVKDPKWPEAFAVFSEQMKYARARGPHPEWPKISKAIQMAIQSTLTHQTDARSALETAQAQIDKVLKK